MLEVGGREVRQRVTKQPRSTCSNIQPSQTHIVQITNFHILLIISISALCRELTLRTCIDYIGGFLVQKKKCISTQELVHFCFTLKSSACFKVRLNHTNHPVDMVTEAVNSPLWATRWLTASSWKKNFSWCTTVGFLLQNFPSAVIWHLKRSGRSFSICQSS